jgi:segregation and condensation protein A
MREAGARLFARDRIGRDVFLREAPEGLRVDTKRSWDASLFELLQAYGVVQARTRPVIHMVARREVMPLDAAIDRLSRLIGIAIDWSDLLSFLPPEMEGDLRRSALASSFVAALELARTGTLSIRQDEAFAPLYLKKAR